MVTVAALAGLGVLMAVPLALRKIPPNRWYGFRIPKTLKDENIWYDANAFFGRGLIYGSLVSVGAIFLLYAIALPEPDLFFKLSLLMLVVPSGAAVIATLIRIRHMDNRLE